MKKSNVYVSSSTEGSSSLEKVKSSAVLFVEFP